MPEGPECKRFVDGLNEELRGQQIDGISFVAGRYVTHGAPFGYETFNLSLPVQVDEVRVKGKFIYFALSDGSYIWNTLGMSGAWSRSEDADVRAIVKYNGKQLYFSDRRNFGTFKFAMNQEETDKKLKSLGFDLLAKVEPAEVSYELFKLKRNQNKSLAEILMNQKNYAGVGNYIKAEALYRAKLSPHRVGSSLSQTEIKLLHDTIQELIAASYYSQTGQKVAAALLNAPPLFEKVVYNRTHDPLGNLVVREDTKDKRTTHWVPAVQK